MPSIRAVVLSTLSIYFVCFSVPVFAACTVPNVIANGQVADATKIMDDLSAVAACADEAIKPTGAPSTGSIAVFSASKTITSGNLTGDITTSGGTATTLKASGVTAGTYSNSTITVDTKGRVTAASSGNGPGGGGGGYPWPQTLPTIRSGASTVGTNIGTSVTVALPSGAVAGDLALLYAAGGNNVVGASGWSVLDVYMQTGWNAAILTKVLDSSDVSAGNVTVGYSGSFRNVAALTVFAGSTVTGISWSNLSGHPNINVFDSTATFHTAPMMPIGAYLIYAASTRENDGVTSDGASLGATNSSDGTMKIWYKTVAANGASPKYYIDKIAYSYIYSHFRVIVYGK